MSAVPNYNKSQEFYSREKLDAFLYVEYQVYYEKVYEEVCRDKEAPWKDHVCWYLLNNNGDVAYGFMIGYWSDMSKRGYAFMPKVLERQD